MTRNDNHIIADIPEEFEEVEEVEGEITDSEALNIILGNEAQ